MTAREFLNQKFGRAWSIVEKHGDTWYAAVEISECTKSTDSEEAAVEELASLFGWSEE